MEGEDRKVFRYIMITKNNSPYTAAITGGGFLYEETGILLPLLQSENSEELLRDEAVNNRLLHINSESSRKRNISEIKRRYNAMPTSFWEIYQNMESNERHVALLFVFLKTYKLLDRKSVVQGKGVQVREV